MRELGDTRQLAMLADPDDPSGNVIIGIARRGVGYIEMSCSKERYKPFELLALFKQHTGDDEATYPVPTQGDAYARAVATIKNGNNVGVR